MQPPILPDTAPPNVFQAWGDEMWLNGQKIEDGDRLYGDKFGYTDVPPDPAEAEWRQVEQVEAPNPGLLQRVADASLSEAAVVIAAVALAAAIWRRKP